MKWIAGMLLAASLALNLYLLAHRVAEVTVPSNARAPVREVTPAPAPDRVAPPPAIAAARDRAALERRLAEVEQRIEELRDPADRWKLGQPTPEAEASVRPYLDKIFAKVGAYDLDCRGGVCRIETKASMDLWMGPLQSSYPDAALFGYEFSYGHAYIQPRELSEGAGMWLWWAITMNADDAAEACMKASSAHGDLTIDFDLDDKTRRVAVRVGGSLANDPVGQCVRRALEDAVAATDVPPDARAVLGQDIRFELPIVEPPH